MKEPRIGDLVNADKRIHLGHLGGELLGKPLGHAPGDNQLLARLLFAKAPVLMGFENGIDGLLLGRVDERTGVHNEHVGFVRLGGDLHAALQDAAQHHFRVGKIFGTAKADETDFDRRSGDGFQGFHSEEKQSNRLWRGFTQIFFSRNNPPSQGGTGSLPSAHEREFARAGAPLPTRGARVLPGGGMARVILFGAEWCLSRIESLPYCTDGAE